MKMQNIRRLARHAEICELLARATHPHTGNSIFGTFRELACFAALLGFERDRKVVLDGPTELLVDARIFERNDQALDMLYLVGLAATRDRNILKNDEANSDRLVSEFERYVAGGLEILKEWLNDDPADENGDRAILSGLHRAGLLKAEPPAADVINRVVF
ncbi:hypothetical protein [Bradyrhizobium sp. 162]|uniref:hypothetical protein n=1 Tax=Bradyrhizobium sp. 162 TaxID=2782635 RepID=UPI001FF877AC|nr:hypothetical protein [Bradyrhizobium sp. 162]MCK1630255.1 hypothetical protein [Bradyrhizobium sp. 162]